MKKVRNHQKGFSFLSALLLILSVFASSSFAEGYTMRVLQRLEDLPANKSFSVRFNDALDLNHILQKRGVLVVDLQDTPQHVKISIDPSNNKVLRIDPPEHGYAPGKEYILYIHNNWSSKSGKKLRKSIQMAFSISRTPLPPNPNPSPNPNPLPLGDFIFDKPTRTITGYRGNATDLVIPEQIDGVPVEAIGDSAFEYKPFTSVVIPNSVITIGNHAFRSCEQLSSLTLGNQVKYIKASAFYDNDLDRLYLPSSVTEIGEWAFLGNSIQSLSIPDSVTEISTGAFQYNELSSLIFGNFPALESIESLAFSDNRLVDVKIPNSILSIGSSAFAKNKIANIQFGTSLQSIGTNAFAENELSMLSLPNHVINVGAGAFRKNQIATLDLSNALTIIKQQTFQENDLLYVIIPDNVQTIEANAFTDNPMTNAELSSHTNVASNAFPAGTLMNRRP